MGTGAGEGGWRVAVVEERGGGGGSPAVEKNGYGRSAGESLSASVCPRDSRSPLGVEGGNRRAWKKRGWTERTNKREELKKKIDLVSQKRGKKKEKVREHGGDTSRADTESEDLRVLDGSASPRLRGVT